MNEDQLQIYHDAKPHRDDLRAVIDSLNQENAALRAKVEGLTRAVDTDYEQLYRET